MAKNMGILVYFLLQSPFLFRANHWNWFWHHSARKGREQMPQRRDGSGEEKKIPKTVGIKGNTLILFILCEFPHQTLPEGYLISDDQVDFPAMCQRKWKMKKKGNQKKMNTAPEDHSSVLDIIHLFTHQALPNYLNYHADNSFKSAAESKRPRRHVSWPNGQPCLEKKSKPCYQRNLHPTLSLSEKAFKLTRSLVPQEIPGL